MGNVVKKNNVPFAIAASHLNHFLFLQDEYLLLFLEKLLSLHNSSVSWTTITDNFRSFGWHNLNYKLFSLREVTNYLHFCLDNGKACQVLPWRRAYHSELESKAYPSLITDASQHSVWTLIMYFSHQDTLVHPKCWADNWFSSLAAQS